jgi:FkbM family methyltransferase
MDALRAVADRLPPKVLVRIAAIQYLFFEPELRHLDDFVPKGKAAVDVGAWWGPWSYWLARRSPQVFTFEPNNAVFSGLSSAMPPNVKLRNVAVSDHEATSSLWAPPTGKRGEGRASLNARPGWVEQTTTTVTLDSFGLENVGFMKIDVEGHELEVLRGASELIASQRPNVVIEVEHGDVDGVFAWFAEREYEGTFYDRGWRPLADWDRELAERMSKRQIGMLRASLLSKEHYINNFLFRSRS